MHLKNGGKTIILHIQPKIQMPNNLGVKSGVFPDEIIVEQKNSWEDNNEVPRERIVYVRKENNDQ